MAFSVEELTACRLCGYGALETVLSLGNQYVVDFVKQPNTTTRGQAPLELVRCEKCNLVQLKHTVNQDALFRKMWYRSDINEAMIQHLKELAETAAEVADLKIGDRVLDIGTNTGVLLGWYPGMIITVGVDPCKELIDEGLAKKRMNVGLPDFFSEDLVKEYGPFKIITAISMFYDVSDPIEFLRQCRNVMTPDGVLIIQMNYLVEMMKNFAVDNISHEHLSYYSLMAMKEAASRAGFEIVGAELNDVNGGSIRVYLTKPNSGLSGISSQRQLDRFMLAMNLLHIESNLGLATKLAYEQFEKGMSNRVTALRDYLIREAASGEKIYIYGASTRGTVTMQLLNLPEGVIQGAAERDSTKYGLYMVGGTWTKIYSEDYCRERATQFLVLPWHYGDGILDREEKFMKNGGKMIIPFPSPRIVTGNGKTEYLAIGEGVKTH
jgi:NDP-4-keto-2,6-dideoxyhexose 3-C-methyltransferase